MIYYAEKTHWDFTFIPVFVDWKLLLQLNIKKYRNQSSYNCTGLSKIMRFEVYDSPLENRNIWIHLPEMFESYEDS